jgi:hypothetical protein
MVQKEVLVGKKQKITKQSLPRHPTKTLETIVTKIKSTHRNGITNQEILKGIEQNCFQNIGVGFKISGL